MLFGTPVPHLECLGWGSGCIPKFSILLWSVQGDADSSCWVLALTPSSSLLLLDQRRQLRMAQALGPLPLAWVIQMELQVPGFGLAQPHLQLLWEQANKWISVYLCSLPRSPVATSL